MKTISKKSVTLALAFFLPAALMALVFALGGICPFGSRSLSVMDMAHQYLSFLSSLRDILSGKASLLYLPSMCLGGNMTGVAAYYLLSPLNFLLCLFPRAQLMTGVSLLYFLRVGLCGLTMCIYTGRRNGYGPRCLFSALAYGFMAYMVAYAFNYLWQDGVILLPLIALGISRLVEQKGPWLYIIALAGALFINFYIGYILCLFSVLFFLYEILSRGGEARIRFLPALGRFALSSLAAGALAAVALLPAFFSLAGGKAEFSLQLLSLTPKFDFIALFSKLYVGAFTYEEIMPTGMPHIFCGTLTSALAVLYFANRRISLRRRLLTGALFAVLALSFWISALDLLWHGLNTPSWYNYRYSFLFSFLLCMAADEALAHLRAGFRPWHAALPAGLAAAVSLLVFLGRRYDYISWPAAAEAVLLVALFCGGILLFLRPGGGKRLGCILAAAALLLQAGELAINAGVSLAELTVPSSNPALYAQYVTAKEEILAAVPESDAYTRVESASSFDMNRCEPMLFGYDGLSHYGSTISQKNLDFLDRLGFDRYTDLWSQYGPGVTAAADTLLGVGYLVDADTPKPYEPLAQTDSYTLWQNSGVLPIAWTADEAIMAPIAEGSAFAYLQSLYAAAAPEVGEDIFIPAELTETALTNYLRQGSLYTRETDGVAAVEYTLAVRADGRLYGEFDIPDFPGVMIFVNGSFVSSYASAQTNGTVYLGNFSAGDTVTVKLQTATDITVSSAAFATENDGAIAAYAQALQAGGCALAKLSPSRYTGSFTTGAGDELLVFTLPWDGAWSLWLDGVPVQPTEVQGCLMALPVSEGAHTVSLRYIPGGLIPGAVISAAALAGCLAVYFLRRRKK